MKRPTKPATPWHSLSLPQTLEALHTDREQGLSAAEAERRLQAHGPNSLPKLKRRPAWLRFLLQFHNILIYVLLASAAGAFYTRDLVDAGVILGVVLINAIIGYIQESKAEDALEAIRGMLSLSATVARDGQRASLPAEALVPGDIVWVQAGDKIPADLRLLDVRGLRVDESALTGESVPVEKSAQAVAADAVIGDRGSMAFAGTLATYGQACGVAAATGEDTELGRINTLLNQVDALETPLQGQLARFGQWLTGLILLLSGAIYAFGVLARGMRFEEMFMAMVGIAVAAIPEGLPAVVTITLAVGVRRMAQHKAIVRHLPAVETLGAVTVICSDKTGTLTCNAMTARAIVTAAGVFTPENAMPQDAAGTLELARAGMLCNEAELQGQAEAAHGDPTETALLALGQALGLDYRAIRRDFARLDFIPFESERRYMASLHASPAGERLIYLKGAPEAVLSLSETQRENGDALPLQALYWQERIQQLAAGGQRVLALAVKAVPAECASLEAGLMAGGFEWLGLCGMIDPPRPEAMQAVARCHSAGIRVKMITGDHGATASAIGAQLNIGLGREALLGAQIEASTDADLRPAAQAHDVFARASPEHKLRLVEALQAQGEVVAMTGDGVNDAPALKRADIGVAMGLKGSEAAKEAAVMVLADDHFATIVQAVEEGRTIYDNLQKAIVFILPTSFGQAAAIVAGILLGLALPITPLQILWVNLVTAITLSLSLSFEPPEPEVMARPPRDPAAPLLGGFFIWRIVFVTLLLLAGILGLFLYELDGGASLETARTAAVNALVAGEIAYLFNSRYIHASALSRRGLAGTPRVWLAIAVLLAMQLAFTYLPLMQQGFATAALDAAAWGRIGAFALLLFLVVELEKCVARGVLRWRARYLPKPAPGAPAVIERRALAAFAWLSIAAAVLTIALKTWAWRLTGSVGLLSDALESLVNLAAAIMALFMLLLAAKPPDDGHHFGHGKAEYFSSGLEGALILVAACGIALAGYERLLHPQGLAALGLGLAISSAAALINLGVALILLKIGRRYHSITLEADARHLLTDVWTSFGVLLGLGAVAFTGWNWLDPAIAFLVAANILWAGLSLIRRSIDGLLDATLPDAENARIDAILNRYREQGLEFHDLRTRQSGADRFLTVHVLAPGDMSIKAGHDWVERIEAEIRAALGEISILTHLEPLEDPASYQHGESAATPGRRSLLGKP
jgi:calcium-translocating P-type ATPase